MNRAPLRVERINDPDRFLQLKDEWNRLEAGPNRQLAPTLTHDWFAIWLDTFGRGELRVLAIFDGENLIGAAPMEIVRTSYRGIPCRLLRLLQNRHAPSCTFLLKKGYEETANRLMEETLELPGWDVLMFDNIPEDSYLHVVCKEKNISTNATIYRRTMSSPLLTIEGSWAAFFESRSRNAKRSLRRNEKRLREAGRVEVDHFTSAESAIAILPTILAIGDRSWKAAGGRAIGSQPESSGLYTRLAEVFGKRDEVSIWVLKLDDKAIAFEFHLVRGKWVYGLRAEFDDAFRSLGVGSVLDKQIVKRLFEMGFEGYDMGGSADFYKLRWTRDAVDHHEFLTFGNSPVGRLLFLIERGIVGPLKRLRKGQQRD